MSPLAADSPAKINLGLEILGRRADGYHELVTIFQKIRLADRLSVEASDRLALVTTAAHLDHPDNLCLRAALALQAATGTRQGALIRLTKRIPVAAGLGGGSSNAAVTLQLLNQLWGTGLDEATLAGLALKLGADVPFFLTAGATALASGIGEALTPLPSPPPLWLVLVRPNLRIAGKTARLYRALTPADWSDGRRTQQQAERLRGGRGLDLALLHNAFSRPLLSEWPAVAAALAELVAAGASPVLPAGSGPTLIAFCPDQTAAQRLATAVQRPGRLLRVTSTLA